VYAPGLSRGIQNARFPLLILLSGCSGGRSVDRRL